MLKRPTARVLATAALVLLILGACSPTESYPPPPPRTLASAERALRIGDINRLRSDLGKDAGLATRAADLAARFDPQAWLVATGTATREHDLERIYKSMQAGNDAELAVMMGFGHQALTADILDGGSSIYARRASGRNYFSSGPQPLDLMNGASLPMLPDDCFAMHATLWGRLEGRSYRLKYALDVNGVTSLQAAHELAHEDFEIGPEIVRHVDAAATLTAALANWKLDLSGLRDERWYGAEFSLLRPSGELLLLKLASDDRGWALLESSTSTQSQRLNAKRDERLRVIQRRAIDFERARGHWPQEFGDLSWELLNVKDPTAEEGLFGWIDYAGSPAIMLELAPEANSGYAVRSTTVTSKGQRAITRGGEFIWLKP